MENRFLLLSMCNSLQTGFCHININFNCILGIYWLFRLGFVFLSLQPGIEIYIL